MVPVVTEYRLFEGRCHACDRMVEAALPPGVSHRMTGPRLLAVIGARDFTYGSVRLAETHRIPVIDVNAVPRTIFARTDPCLFTIRAAQDLVYLAYVGADLIDLRYWARTPGERAILLGTVWPNPFAVVAGVLAREISIWTGAWLAARGRKLKARNAEAQADYEQQLADAQNQAAAAYVQQGY